MQVSLFDDVKNNEVRISSIEVARVTGKLHKNVIRDIEGQLSIVCDLLKFERIYRDTQNRDQKCYDLPKREAMILVSGYNIELRAKIIDRLQQLEDELSNRFNIPQTYAEALMIAAQQAQEIEDQRKQLIIQAPKVKFAEAVAESVGSVDIATFSKMMFDKNGINIGEKRLFAWMRNHGYLMTNGSDRNKPYQRYLESGYFDLKSGTYINQSTGDRVQYTKTKITGKGQIYFANKLIEYFSEKVEA